MYRNNVMAGFHVLLALANTAIIVGGSFLANADLAQFDSTDTQRRLRISRSARTAGQSVFLGCNAVLLIIILVTMRNDRRSHVRKSGFHPTLVVLLLTWMPLIVRGSFGVIQSADFEVCFCPRGWGLLC
jgi:hypothetical protein